jgi:hypothetical protein
MTRAGANALGAGKKGESVTRVSEDAPLRLSYERRGRGEPLLLIHGAGSYRRVRDILVGFLSRFRPGSDGFAVKVEAEGLIGERPELYSCSIWGYGEGRTTGIVAALVAESLFASPSGPGVFHIEQLFEPVELFGRVEDLGLSVDLWDGRFE